MDDYHEKVYRYEFISIYFYSQFELIFFFFPPLDVVDYADSYDSEASEEGDATCEFDDILIFSRSIRKSLLFKDT